MATFRVGQRVRIKWSNHWPELNGEEGLIVGRCKPGQSESPHSEWFVAPDCWGTERAPQRRGTANCFAPASSQLEPLQPEGWQKVEWSECLWIPPHLREASGVPA